MKIKILLSKDGNEFAAHALEMDLVAYGKTESMAIAQLRGLIRNQISFAIEKGEDRLIDFRAPPEYFNQWEKLIRNEAPASDKTKPRRPFDQRGGSDSVSESPLPFGEI